MIPERITTHNSLLNYDAGAGGIPGSTSHFPAPAYLVALYAMLCWTVSCKVVSTS